MDRLIAIGIGIGLAFVFVGAGGIDLVGRFMVKIYGGTEDWLVRFFDHLQNGFRMIGSVFSFKSNEPELPVVEQVRERPEEQLIVVEYPEQR